VTETAANAAGAELSLSALAAAAAVKDGRVARRAGIFDEAGILRQLGVLPGV
jgi:hypothetical protein